MNRIAFSLFLLFLLTPAADAAGVKMKQLKDFDPAIHTVSVNTQVEMSGGCYIDKSNISEAFEFLLTRFGFQTAPVDESQLEFAVSVKGFELSGPHACGVMVLSMVRQIPKIRMLRISPGSTSKEYRLWTVETAFTATGHNLPSLLQEQARKDVVEFSRKFKSSKK